jgi:DNA-binding beta-propeller fold protein YncE
MKGAISRIICLLFFLSVGFPLAGHAQRGAPVRLLQIVRLPGVHGRIDHFDVDLRGHRLFMSALGNNTVEVFDLRTSRLIHTIRGLREPQGVTYSPASDLLFIANGDDGMLRILDGTSYQLRKMLHFPSDADDTRYDAATNRVYVGYGDKGDAGIAVVDGSTGDLLETIPLPAHPESFQLSESTPAIYVNIPSDGNIIDVVDRKTRKITATWTLHGAKDNFPMALDEKDHRLFITCRSPAEVLVLDTQSGKIIARLPAVTHADDMWYDATRKRIYVSGGGGFLTVIQQDDADHYRPVAEIKTAPGARTSCLVPQLNRLYLGVWGQGGSPEELRVYKLQP